MTDANNPGLREGQTLGRHYIRRCAALPEINAFFYELVHSQTGAQHVHISREDPENTFSVAFKTVPADSTGVAHILEHTALCGSSRYPVRDPFFSMLKRSLSTFMNAFTSSDWTMYPFATQNRKDFYNLLDVYLDAAFYPKLDALSFKQEGHRLDFEPAPGSSDRDGRLVYKGVVYNEMKGAMSSPDQVLARNLLKALYPDTTYSFNSGGEPAVIPTLSWDALKAFHARHYHPSNAFFYTYGSFPLADHLAYIEERILQRFDPIDPGTRVPAQPRWRKPKRAEFAYPLAPSEDPTHKYQATLAWLTADVQDTFEVLALTLLEYILIGHSAAPLRKALIDSGLGSALADATGFVGDQRDTMFACGLKDIRATDAEKVAEIVQQSLRRLVEEGIDPDAVESALHQLEFHRKEVTNHPYPYGIKLLLTFCGAWFHGADPLRLLFLDDDLDRIRRELESGRFFEERIERYFLDNPHRALVTLKPDPEMEQRENERTQAELRQIEERLTPEERARIQQDAAALQQLQETPEDISCLPTLLLTDIPAEVQVFQGVQSSRSPFVVRYDQPTGGIFYFTAAMGLGHLSSAQLPLVPFFCHALTRAGTRRHDYTDIAKRIAACTGGVSAAAHARTGFAEAPPCLPFMAVTAKCLSHKHDEMVALLQELMAEFDFSDIERLKNLLRDYRAGMESRVVHNGHRLAMSLAGRAFSKAQALNELWHGVHQLKTIKALTADLTADRLAVLGQDLQTIGEACLCRSNCKFALIGEGGDLARAQSSTEAIWQSLAEGDDAFHEPGVDPGTPPVREGWTTATAVSFVARTVPTVRMGHADSAALAVAGKLLRALFLHREIREKGGAYGGFSLYNPEDGLFSFASYRDPHIVSTLEAYTAARDFICAGRYGEEDVKEAILQVCSDIDKPDPPGQGARKAFWRSMIGLSDDMRQDFKRQLLSVDRARVMAASRTYFAGPPSEQGVAVISSAEKLAAANSRLVPPLDVHAI